VVDGEVIWDEPDGYYHHYPSMPRVRAWQADAGFALDEEAEGPWHQEGYAYHHVLARLAARQAENVGPFGTWIGRDHAVGSSAVTEDNFALDVRGSPGKTAVRMRSVDDC
jgi:hypothetical protein